MTSQRSHRALSSYDRSPMGLRLYCASHRRLALALALLVWVVCSFGRPVQAQTAHAGATAGPLPSTAVGSSSTASKINFIFDTAGTLASTPYVALTQGTKDLDFKTAATQDSDACVTGHAYAVNDTCSVSVVFSPTVPGQRLGAVQLIGSSGTPVATGYIFGVGTGPIVTFPPGVMSTVAGNGAEGNAGDGGAATSAQVTEPAGVVVDAVGNLYISDGYNLVRKVDRSGTITTIAGTTSGNDGGDGGPATSARLSAPEGLAVDGAGNLYIADTVDSRIRKVDATGTITTVAGGGGPQGYSGDGGPATSARLYLPTGVAVDGAGNLYIADYNNSRVRKVDLSGTITTVAGNGTQGYSGDGGPATNAELYYPQDLAVDAMGNLFIMDSGNFRIRKVDTSGTITTFAPAITSDLSGPVGMTMDEVGNLYVADYSNRIFKVDTSGNVSTVAGNSKAGYSGDGGPATSAELDDPMRVAVDGTGNLYIADYYNNRIRMVDVADPPFLTFTSTAVGSTSSDSPQSVAVLNDGNASLNFPPPSSGQNPSIGADFAIDSSATCPLASSGGSAATLMAGAACALPVNFIPQKPGSIAGQLVLTDNNLNQANATQTILLNGTATGSAGTPQPVLAPAMLSFGNISVGTSSSPQVATLSNTGTAPLTISSFGFFGANISSFSQTSNCGSTLAAGASCSITITCTPTASGALSANLGANFPSPLAQQSVALSCTGVAVTDQVTLTPPNYDFGTLNVGVTSSSAVFTLTQTGDGDVTLNQIQITGPNAGDFVTTGGSCTTQQEAASRAHRPLIKPSAHPLFRAEDDSSESCTIVVLFTPSAAGQEAATLSVTESLGTLTSALSGTGAGITAAPQAALTPANAGFGSVNTGSASTSQTFTLTNAGNAALPISSIQVIGANASDFVAESNTCGTSLAAGSSCTIGIVFKPSIAGSESAALMVVDSVGTQSSALSGTGTAVSVSSSDFTLTAKPASQTGMRGASVSYTLLLGSADASNPFTQPVNLSATGLPSGATVAFSPGSLVPGAANAATSTMTVTIPALTTQVDHESRNGMMLAGVSATPLLLCFGLTGSRRRRSLRRLMFAIFGFAAMATWLTGCGSATGFAPPASTSTITVTGTSGNITHSTTITLVVK